jgi:hypothetical protein
MANPWAFPFVFFVLYSFSRRFLRGIQSVRLNALGSRPIQPGSIHKDVGLALAVLQAAPIQKA